MAPSPVRARVPLSPVPFEVTSADLRFALAACAHPHAGDTSAGDLAAIRAFSRGDHDDDHLLVTASARAAFDLLLASLPLAPGDEVLFTPTIAAMPDIARERGLVPVDVDLHHRTLAPLLTSLEGAIGPRSRVLVIAHLFGARVDVGPAIRLAHSRGLVVVEDRAQAFHRRDDPGHPDADVVIHSFGVLKTASALGGAVTRVRDRRLGARIDAAHDAWPVQATAAYARTVLGHVAVSMLATRDAHAAAVRAFTTLGHDLDDLAMQVVSSGRSPHVPRCRERPSSALLSVLARRLGTFAPSSIAERATAVRRVAHLLPRGIVHVGGTIAEHAHWVLPVAAARPERLVASLRAAGFHATRRAVALDGSASEQGRRLLDRLVYLPFAPAADDVELADMQNVMRRHADTVERAHRDSSPASLRLVSAG